MWPDCQNCHCRCLRCRPAPPRRPRPPRRRSAVPRRPAPRRGVSSRHVALPLHLGRLALPERRASHWHTSEWFSSRINHREWSANLGGCTFNQRPLICVEFANPQAFASASRTSNGLKRLRLVWLQFRFVLKRTDHYPLPHPHCDFPRRPRQSIFLGPRPRQRSEIIIF